jgi:hypothetical protein
MSEYQYYDFLAVDRPLTTAETKRLRKLSTRAEITATSFTNTYNWGDFGGSPEKMMEQYFDAHVYMTNWGSYHLMLRFPRGTLDEDQLSAYCVDDPFSFWTTKEHIIIWWCSESEDGGDWSTSGEGWLQRLIQIRNEIEKGDYRSLYIGWLLAISTGYSDENFTEPAVPPGLASLTATQKSLVEFLDLDQDLVSAAATASESPSTKVDETESMNSCIEQLRDDEMRKMLLQVLKGETQSVQSELRRRYNQFLKQLGSGDSADSGNPRRTSEEIFELIEEARQKRLKREAQAEERRRAAAERKRRKYLDELAKRFPEEWEKVEGLAERQTGSAYAEAVESLVDMSDAYNQAGHTKEFNTQLSQFLSRHQHRAALIKRMNEAGLKPTVRVI